MQWYEFGTPYMDGGSVESLFEAGFTEIRPELHNRELFEVSGG